MHSAFPAVVEICYEFDVGFITGSHLIEQDIFKNGSNQLELIFRFNDAEKEEL